MSALTTEQVRFVERQRVGRLATADRAGMPHVIPVCYAYAEGEFYIALDAKPKRVEVTALKRVRNLLENPQVALIIDHYSDDWRHLAYLLVHGVARLLPPDTTTHAQAVALLRARYPQYLGMMIDLNPIISIQIDRVVVWGSLNK